MILPASHFVFRPPPSVARARRVLIKPHAPYPPPYPATTSRGMLAKIIEGIRRISDADIIIMEGNPEGKPMQPIYQQLGYNFPRVLMMDVKDCLWIEIDNPLAKPYALTQVWMPNVLLSCDFWISTCPFQIRDGMAAFTIWNLLGLLPIQKYRRGELEALSLEKMMADLYFTVPFDLGIVEGQKKFIWGEGNAPGRIEELGKVFVGEPFEVDSEAAQAMDLQPQFLELIKVGKKELER